MKDERIFLSADQAISLLKIKGKSIHNMKSCPFGIVGCSSSVSSTEKILREAESIEISGEGAFGMGHGICVAPKGAKMASECIFFEHDEESMNNLMIKHKSEVITQVKEMSFLKNL